MSGSRARADGARRAVVFHADDFGMNRAVTAGILRGFSHGLLTSTALLSNAPDAAPAIREWRLLQGQHAAGRLASIEARTQLREPREPFELGVHLNLTQGRPLSQNYPPQLLDAAGRFCGVGRLFRHLRRPRPSFELALRQELATQVEFLLDHGIHPTHVNGHQYIEMLPGLRSSLQALIARYGIRAVRVPRESGLWRTTLLNGRFAKNWGLDAKNWSLAQVKRYYAGRLERDARGWNVQFAPAFFGTSHAGRVDVRLVGQFLESETDCRLIEIGLHPAIGLSAAHTETEDGWADPLAAHRPKELDMLTGPELVRLLQARGMTLGRLNETTTAAATKAA
jgi:chitin disaccharide deacetylase